MTVPQIDHELEAMRAIAAAMAPLSAAERARVLAWARARYGGAS